MKQIRLIALAPGHFHASLVHKRMLPEVHRHGFVYAPLDADTIAHLNRIAGFNSRLEDPTGWEIDLRSGPNWMERFAREQPGNTVVLSGRNKSKIDLMQLAIDNGLNVLADKPWVIEHTDFHKIEELYQQASLREVLLWDMLTERQEITNRILRELVSSPEIFGWWHTGTAEYPALMLESLHYLKKSVSGQPLLRPWWWFDPAISGEALADVGVHLADLAIWLISPDRAVDYRSDIKLLDADRWPLVLSAAEFCELTGLPGYPLDLKQRVVNGQLYYSGNNTVTFTLNGVHVKLTAMWEYENPSGGTDSHKMLAIGTKARIAVRSGADGVPELFATAINAKKHKDLVRLLEDRLSGMQSRFPGVAAVDLGSEVQVTIPGKIRTTHESHFTAILEEFARYFHSPRAVPPWEQPNALARYYITTKGVDMARQNRRSR